MKKKGRRRWQRGGILISAVIFLISAVKWGETRVQAGREADTIAQLVEITQQREGTTGQDRQEADGDQKINQEAGLEIPPERNQERDHENRDYAKLAAQNPDFAGWLWIPGTKVDLPVMNSQKEPQKYLRKDFFGRNSAGGSLFFAERCGPESSCILIYGHNMRNGTMFGSLERYQKRDYWEKHRQIVFFNLFDAEIPDTSGTSETLKTSTSETPDTSKVPESSSGQSRYEVFAVFRTTVSATVSAAATATISDTDEKNRSGEIPYYAYVGNPGREQFEKMIAQIRAHAFYETGIVPEYGDQILMLSTCSYHAKNGRFVVVARKREKKDY